MVQVMGYFTAPIRGKKGSKASKETLWKNIEAGKRVAAQIRKFFGSMLEIYCPHDQDDLIQILWWSKKITIKDILEGDCEIVSKKDILIAWLPEGKIYGGSKKEIARAREEGIPVVLFKEFNDEVAIEILMIILQIFGEKL